MIIAVVGGGTHCERLMEIIEGHRFENIHPHIVAVADLNPAAPGFVKAARLGLFTTADYNDFFERDDIELIIELTNNMDIYNDILKKKKASVRAISTRTAMLFWEIYSLSNIHKKISQELHETKARYSTIFNKLVHDEVMVISQDYRITDINDTLLQKLGLGLEEVIGRHCYEITHHRSAPCSGDRHPCPLIQTLETEKSSQTTHIHLDKNGKKLYYSISTHPLIENDKVVGAIELARDITQEMNFQRLMLQQEKLASIGRLSAGVAHEINNPLTTVLTTAMLIQEDLKTDDPLNQDMHTIVRETLRCRKIVSSLLDFARQSKPVKQPYQINDIVTESILLTKKQAAFNDVGLQSDFAENIPSIQVDKGQIEQALINLIMNAVEATPSGGEIRVATGLATETSAVCITISDNGSGIPDDAIDKIFEPFFTTKTNGTGLGLAITHGIIESHGGHVAVQSRPGQGTRFTISLPLAQGGPDAA